MTSFSPNGRLVRRSGGNNQRWRNSTLVLLPVHQLLRVLGSEVRGFFRCRGQILSDWPLREKNQRPRSRRPVSAPALQTAYVFLVRTTTAEISAASITASKKSAPVNCERWTSLSPTFSIFPPIFSP